MFAKNCNSDTKMSHCTHLHKLHLSFMKKIKSLGLLALLFFTLKGIAWLVVLFLGTNSFWKYIQGLSHLFTFWSPSKFGKPMKRSLFLLVFLTVSLKSSEFFQFLKALRLFQIEFEIYRVLSDVDVPRRRVSETNPSFSFNRLSRFVQIRSNSSSSPRLT